MLVVYYFAVGFAVSVIIAGIAILIQGKKPEPIKVDAQDFIILWLFWPFFTLVFIVTKAYKGLDEFLKRLQDYDE